jgi:cell division protein ZapA (FtsZ GTPase activity inhibitor)
MDDIQKLKDEIKDLEKKIDDFMANQDNTDEQGVDDNISADENTGGEEQDPDVKEIVEELDEKLDEVIKEQLS